MQLKVARLCLDCEEVHDAQQCPMCASESFAYLDRWIATPERRARPRLPESVPPARQERVEAVRGLRTGQMVTGGILGITTLGVLGWLWGRKGTPPSPDPTGGSGADGKDSAE